MKKALLLLMLSCSIFAFNANAIGIEIEVIKGIREWNDDQTKAECIGPKKTCKFKFKVDFPFPLSSAAAVMSPGEGGIINNGGTLTISLPASTLTDPVWSEIFTGTNLSISADIELTAEEQAALGAGCPSVIPEGEYPYVVEGGVVNITI